MNKVYLKAKNDFIVSIHIDGNNYIVEDGIVEIEEQFSERLKQHGFELYIPTIKLKKGKK